MSYREEQARRALHSLGHSLYDLSQEERDQLRETLDRVDDELRPPPPPPPPPPPRPLAIIEVGSWQTNSVSGVRKGTFARLPARMSHTGFRVLENAPGSSGYYRDQLQVSVGNWRASFHVRGRGALRVMWYEHRLRGRPPSLRQGRDRVLFDRLFETQGQVIDLPPTQVEVGYVVVFARALPVPE